MRANLTIIAVLLSQLGLVGCDETPAGAPDAAAPDAGVPAPRDAEILGSPRDASTRDAAELLDSAAQPGDSSAPAPDGGGLACDVDAAQDGTCSGYLCTSDAGSFLALEQNEPWRVGGLDWVSSLCARPLGWPRAFTSDLGTLLFALTLRDRDELAQGAPAFVYWGAGDAPPGADARRCDVRLDATPPSCPATPAPALHASLTGCRGPQDPGCSECRTEAGGYQSASEGADWYHSWSAEPRGACAGGAVCPACARCSYRDASDLEASAERPDCQPCPADNGVDPCFGAGSCGCWCSITTALAASCPTLAR